MALEQIRKDWKKNDLMIIMIESPLSLLFDYEYCVNINIDM